jgi:hypothetical protein
MMLHIVVWNCLLVLVSVIQHTEIVSFAMSILNYLLLHAEGYQLPRTLSYLKANHQLQSWQSQVTLYARSIPNAVRVAPLEDEQVMLETCRGS